MKTELSNQIVSIRKNLRLTQSEFAYLLGIKQYNLAKYEKGKTVPPGNVVFEIMTKYATKAYRSVKINKPTNAQ